MISEFLIRKGQVTCPAQGLDGRELDIRVSDGMIKQIAPSIDIYDLPTINAAGHLVTPALIDLHTHIYWGATSLSVDANIIARRSGTGTFVDAGSAGGGNIAGFREFIAKNNDLRCFAFLNVSFAGIFGFSKTVMVGEGEIARLINADICEEAARENPNIIVGIKVRAGANASGKNGALAIEVGKKVARKLNLPLMCHVDASPPSIEEGLAQLEKDLTHCSKPAPNTVVSDDGDIIPSLKQAIDRGVLLDIGHGMGGFDFEVCRKMLNAGIQPDTISSDVHSQCVDGPAHDQLTTLNKLIALGMPGFDAFKACTMTPAKIIRNEDLGSLKVGTPADISIFKWQEAPKTFVDASSNNLETEKHLTCEGLFVNGRQIGDDGRAIDTISFGSGGLQ